jgi:hypothetical protein
VLLPHQGFELSFRFFRRVQMPSNIVEIFESSNLLKDGGRFLSSAFEAVEIINSQSRAVRRDILCVPSVSRHTRGNNGSYFFRKACGKEEIRSAVAPRVIFHGGQCVE